MIGAVKKIRSWLVIFGNKQQFGTVFPWVVDQVFKRGWHRRKLSVKPGITCAVK
jgi:hypothetical protein